MVMKKTLLILSITLLGTLLGFNVMGQDTPIAANNLTLGMPEVTLLKSSSTVSLLLTTANAGEAVKASVSDTTARLKISSVVAAGKTRTLSAKVTTGPIPAGTTLTLMALSPTVGLSYGGVLGSLVGSDVTLTTGSDATIISSIGSCFSGTAANDGYRLKYTWGLDNPGTNYGAIRATGAGVTITVTLTLSAGV